MTSLSFFLSGEATDRTYVNVRDSDTPKMVEAKAFVETLWPIYRPLADSHFQSDARNHFLQRFWEMYVACALMERGLKLQKVGDDGLEFFFCYEGRRIWVEAIAPGPGQGPDRVPEIVYGEASMVPSEKVLLRFTSALNDKLKKVELDLKKGLLNKHDRVLLAINSRGIPHGPYGADMPFFLKAFLPFGNLTIELNPKTLKVIDTYHTYRPVLKKQNTAEVQTTTFLHPRSAPIVAVLHSAVDCVNRPDCLGGDFDILHNPSAAQQLPRDLLSWCIQYE